MSSAGASPWELALGRLFELGPFAHEVKAVLSATHPDSVAARRDFNDNGKLLVDLPFWP